MWIALTFSAIALTGIEFMVWFLLGLLRERALSVYNRMGPVPGRSKRDRHQVVLGRIYCEQDCRAANGEHNDCNVQFLGEPSHAKRSVPGLIVFSIDNASRGLGSRSIQPGCVDVTHKYKFRLGGSSRKARNAGGIEGTSS